MTDSLVWLGVASPFILALVFSIADGWWPHAQLTDVKLNRAQVIENDLVVTEVGVFSDRSVGWVELELQFPSTLQPQGSARFLTGLRAGQTQSWTVPTRAVRWGLAGPELAVLITQDRLGISQQIQRIPLTSTVRVFPPAEKLKSLVPLYKERQVTGEHRSKSLGSGSELAQARFYRFGDPIRMIHPRLSARRGEPVVLERHPERSSTLVLLVDTAQDLGIGIETTLRWTVTAAMSLAERHLLAQDKMGLLDIGLQVRWLPPKLGSKHLHTVVDTLLASQAAAIRPSSEARLEPPADLPRSSTIVAISPLLSEHTLLTLMALRTQGHNIVVLKPGMPLIPPDLNHLAQRIFRLGNELNERWLTERGSIVIPWQPGTSLEQMMTQVSQSLGRFQTRART